MHAAVPCGTRDSPVRNSGPVQHIATSFSGMASQMWSPAVALLTSDEVTMCRRSAGWDS